MLRENLIRGLVFYMGGRWIVLPQKGNELVVEELWVTMGGRWIVLPQKDNELVVEEREPLKDK